jgi:hypothetical protein
MKLLAWMATAGAAAVTTGMTWAQEADLNRPSARPTAVIPFLAKAPTIDGVIGDGEWATLHVGRFVSQQSDLLQQRPGEFWVGCDRKRIYIAVRSGVHPSAGAVTKIRPEAGAGAKDEQGTVFDDSIELFFNNAPEGGAGEYYQVLVNSAGALYDQEFDAAEKIGRTYWRAPVEQVHKVEKGIWTAEFAIDLASIKVKDPSQPLAMRVCRNYKHNWDQSRWAPRVIAFDAPETMPRIRFADNAPIVSEVGFQDEKGICVAIDVTNPGAKPLPLKVKLGYNAESQPRYFSETPAELKPGETRRFEYRKDLFTGDNYPALAEILVTAADGAVLHHRDVKWQTKPKGNGWAPMGDAPPEEAVQLGFEFHPTPRVARWKVEYAGMKGREEIRAVRLEIAPTDAGAKAVATFTVTPSPTFEVPVRSDTIANLKDGIYEARVYLDGAKPADKPIKTAIFGLRTDFPWLNNTIGEDDIVIPPYTPMEVSGRAIKTILREHQLADNGLWQQVTADGRPMLAGPMRIEVVRDGKTEIAQGKAQIGARKPTAVEADAAWQTVGVKGRTHMNMEYDGCAKVTVTLTPADDQPIDALRLVIPLKDAETPLMHAAGDGIRFNYAGVVPQGEGRVWGSDKASRSQMLGTFLPYVWVGGESRGLCWFAGNDKDWVLDPKEQVAALELHRKAGALELVVNLVQVPAAMQRERTIVFGLQATPARPMPENWRRMGVTSAVPENYQILGMCSYWGADLYNVAPRRGDYEIVRKIASRGRGELDTAFFNVYKARNSDIQAEINWSANGGKVDGIIPYTNMRGDNDRNAEWFVYQDEWRNAAFSDRTPPGGHSGPVDFCVALAPSRVDFLLYHYKKLLENGFAAIYWDNIYIMGNANPITGAAYLRGIGGMQPEADIWQIREVTRRTAVLLHLMGKKNVSVPHMTNALLVPAFCWTGINLDWEWKYGSSDYQDRFKRDYIRACSLGLSHGGVPMILDGTKDTRSAAEREWVDRTQVAATIPHEIKVWQAPAIHGKLMQVMMAVGYGEPGCAVHHYWDENPVAKLEGIDGIWIAIAGKDKVLLVVSDYGNGGTAKVTLDTARLGLPANFKAVDAEKAFAPFGQPVMLDKAFEQEVGQGLAIAAQGGAITLKDIRKHDFRALLIRKR